MNFKDHLKYGAFASVSLASVYVSFKSGWSLPLTVDPGETALVFGLCLAGSLSPDLDTHSTPSRVISFLVSIFCVFSIYQQEPYPALIIATGLLFIKSLSHRGWIHTYTIVFIIGLIGIISSLWLLIPFAIGMIVHLKIGDSLDFFKKSNWIKSFKIL